MTPSFRTPLDQVWTRHRSTFSSKRHSTKQEKMRGQRPWSPYKNGEQHRRSILPFMAQARRCPHLQWGTLLQQGKPEDEEEAEEESTFAQQQATQGQSQGGRAQVQRRLHGPAGPGRGRLSRGRTRRSYRTYIVNLITTRLSKPTTGGHQSEGQPADQSQDGGRPTMGMLRQRMEPSPGTTRYGTAMQMFVQAHSEATSSPVSYWTV